MCTKPFDSLLMSILENSSFVNELCIMFISLFESRSWATCSARRAFGPEVILLCSGSSLYGSEGWVLTRNVVGMVGLRLGKALGVGLFKLALRRL